MVGSSFAFSSKPLNDSPLLLPPFPSGQSEGLVLGPWGRFTTEAEGPPDPRFTGRNNQQKGYAMKRFTRGFVLLAVYALLPPTAASGQTRSFTATGWVSQVLAPGILYPDAYGQVLYRGGVHTARVQSTDTRVTGQVTIITDGTMNADGTANFQGSAYFQVGTWDTAGTNFTATGGVWEWTWHGVMQTNYSLQLNATGYGIGGAIDSQSMELTLTRGPASGPVDFAVPYLYAGTIKPPPLSTNFASEDFSSNVAMTISKPYGNVSCAIANGQLVTSADWAGAPHDYRNLCFFTWPTSALVTTPLTLGDEQTLQCQIDVVGVSDNSTNTTAVMIGTYNEFYVFHLGKRVAFLLKYVSGQANYTMFWCDNTLQSAHSNIVQSLSLTRDQANIILTTRVLDKANQNALLFERGFVDTPAVDPSLTTAQLTALIGENDLTLGPDFGAPIRSFIGGSFGATQLSNNQPGMGAIFDNYVVRLSDVPPLWIAQAVQLSYPAPAGVNYSLEAAPAVQGPWLKVQDLAVPGLNQRTVPASGSAQFFRLIQGP
jgi:hypothetical protein